MNGRQLNAMIRALRAATDDGEMWMPGTLYIVDERPIIYDRAFLLVVETPDPETDDVLATVTQ